MADQYLTFSAGLVMLGDTLLPGIFVSMHVSAGVRFDRAYREHMSGRTKIPQGWEDADIKLTMDLVCDEDVVNGKDVPSTCYDKLDAINRIFKGMGKGANPQVFTVTNAHLISRGIQKVVFSGLESDEDDQSDVIRVTLSFSEHLPAVVKKEKQVATAKTPAGTPAAKAKPAASAPIVQDNPFIGGLKAGFSDIWSPKK